MSNKNADHYFLRGGGEMGELIRAKDWSQTSLGNPSDWPDSLRTMVAVMLDNPFGMYIAWGSDYIQLYNDGYRPILGANKHPQALGISTRETFSEIWDNIIGSMFDDVMKGEAVGYPDLMLPLNRNGFIEECYFDFSYSPIRKNDGEVGGVLVTVIETTEKKKAQDALIENTTQLKFAMDAAELGTWDYNPATNKFTCNHRMREWFGLSAAAEIALHHATDIIVEKDRNRIINAIETALNYESGGNYEEEFSIINPINNNIIIFQVKGKAWFNEEKIAYRFTGTLQEVTENVLARKSIEESEARFRAIADDAPVFIFLAGENAEVEYLNKTWREYTGISTNDSKGRAWAEITHIDDIEPATKIYMDGFNKRESCSFENRQKGTDGIYRTILWKATPRFSISGQFIGMMGVGLDIHERKKSEEKLRESETQKAFLLKLSDTLRQQSNPDGIEEAVTKIALDFLEADWCHFCTIEGDNVIIHHDAVRGTLPSMVGLYPISSYPLFKSILDDGNPFVVDNVQTTLILDAALKQLCVHLQNIAFINVPVIKNGKPVAMLSLVQSEPRNWTVAEVQLIIAIAERTWAAVERTKAEKALLKSEEKYRTLFNSIDQGFLLGELIRNDEGKGIDYYVHEVNSTYEKQTGINIELVLGKTVLQAFPTIDKWWIETYASVVDNQYPVRFERFFEFTNRWFEIKASPAGKEMFIILFTDITERILAVEKIKESKERLNIVIEASELGTWEVDLITNDFSYSNRYLEIMGYPHNTIITIDDTEKLVHSDYLEAKQEAIKKSRETGVFYFAGKIIWEDNSIHWIESKAKLFYDEQNNPIKIIGTTADITKERNHQLELEESEEKFRLLADSMPQHIWTSNPEGNLNYFNQSVFDYSGLTLEQINQDGWLQIVHPDDREENIKKWTDSIVTGKDFLLEHRFRRHDETYRWQLSRAIPQRDSHGNIQMWVGTSTDIQDQKTFATELERQVDERTKELGQKNNELQKINKELESFVYVSSHDLQEPLRKIQTFASRILEKEVGNLSEMGKDNFDRMQKAAQRMQTLIQDLLSYSRTNSAEYKLENTDLNKIIAEIKDELKEELKEKNATIEANQLGNADIIPFQFRQIMNNLIINSLKFAKPENPPHIRIKSEIANGSKFNNVELSPQNEYCHITFSDNGIGFEPRYNEKIFELFKRLHGRNEYNGTGIGLSIVKKIVENHNGIITANGELNKGATFDIYIPTK